MPKIRIPNEWAPTSHQLPLWQAMKPRDGLRRGVAVWHRRAGKDSTAINLIATKAFQRVGTYWHLLPSLVQARRVIWKETDRHGRRIIDQAFPPELRVSKSEQDMDIRLVNGSLYQLGGSDNYNSLVGTNVCGVVFSEWSLCDPAAWDYIRPILVENDGWALFVYTPRGRNHGWTLWEHNKAHDHWFHSKLDITQTQRDDETGSPIMTEEQVEQEIADGMSYEAAQQEFYCSFAAGVVGAYFAREVEDARKDGRIGKVAYDPRLAVHLYFDLGIDDATAVWAGQRHGYERRWIRYQEWRDTAFEDVLEEVTSWGYRLASLNLPHDGRQRDKWQAKSIEANTQEYLEQFSPGSEVIQHDAYPVKDSIEAGRALLKHSWIDEEHCSRGLDCLMNYAKSWDEKRRVYMQQPLHNWASHGADAWRLAGMDDIDTPWVDEDTRSPIRVPNVRRSVHFTTRRSA